MTARIVWRAMGGIGRLWGVGKDYRGWPQAADIMDDGRGQGNKNDGTAEGGRRWLITNYE